MNQTAGATNAYRRCSKGGKVRIFREVEIWTKHAAFCVRPGMVQLLGQHGSDTGGLQAEEKLCRGCFQRAGLLRVCALWRCCKFSPGYTLLAAVISLIKMKDVCGQFTNTLGAFWRDKPICVVHTATKMLIFASFFLSQRSEKWCRNQVDVSVFHISM